MESTIVARGPNGREENPGVLSYAHKGTRREVNSPSPRAAENAAVATAARRELARTRRGKFGRHTRGIEEVPDAGSSQWRPEGPSGHIYSTSKPTADSPRFPKI